MSKLLSDIKNDWINHDKDWTRPGFRALAFYRFGVWRMGIKPVLLRAPLSILYRHLYRKARNRYGIELPFTVNIGSDVVIEHQHGIVVNGYAEIGDGTIIRQGVTIGIRHLNDLRAVPKIGKRVNIGAGAKVLGAITIGDDVVIGANAVVIKDVDTGQTVVGIPAKPITKRHS